MDLRALIGRGISVKGYTLYELAYHAENMPGLIDYVRSGVADGTYKPNLDRIFPFEKIADAHNYIAAGSTRGSVILQVHD